MGYRLGDIVVCKTSTNTFISALILSEEHPVNDDEYLAYILKDVNYKMNKSDIKIKDVINSVEYIAVTSDILIIEKDRIEKKVGNIGDRDIDYLKATALITYSSNEQIRYKIKSEITAVKEALDMDINLINLGSKCGDIDDEFNNEVKQEISCCSLYLESMKDLFKIDFV